MKDHRYFDKFARDHKMRPVDRRQSKFGDILLADSGEAIVEGGKLYYRTGYAIERAGLEFGNWYDYEIGEAGGSASEQKFRLDEAEMNATMWLSHLDESGYFDADRKQDFSPEPGN